MVTGLCVLVCGGRDFTDSESVREVLGSYRIAAIGHGAARGADSLAADWAVEHGIPVCAYRADWKNHGKGAGPIRNRRMLAEFKPDLVVAFPGGRGTAHMVNIARAAGVEVFEVAR